VVFAIVLVSSCGKGNPGPQQQPDNVDNKPAPALKGDPGHTTKVTGANNYAPDITLPKGTGAPPIKTTGPLDPKKLASLSSADVAGFAREVTKNADGALELEYTTKSRPRLRVTVHVEPCKDAKACTKMDVDAWKAKGSDDLKRFLDPKLAAKADTEFDVEGVTLNGAALVGTYQLGYDGGSDSAGNPFGTVTNAYVAYYNDGANQIYVVAEYRDDMPKSLKALAGYAPRDTLKMMATRFLDYFTANWA
jgi:hypothetical protein